MENKIALYKTKQRFLATLMCIIMLVAMVPKVDVAAVEVTNSIIVTARCTAAGIEVDKPTGNGTGHYYCVIYPGDGSEEEANKYVDSGYGIFIAPTRYTLLQNEKTTITTYSVSAVTNPRNIVNGTYGVFIFYTTDDKVSTVFGYTLIDYSKPGIDTWSELQTALSVGGTAKLTGDVTASATDVALTVPNGVTANIDLNSCSIDRNLSYQKNNGNVIVNNGNLTISDSSVYKSGSIVGGNNNGDGGGIINNGTLTISSGSIENNKCYGNGGGIFNDGICYMSGGTITQNYASNLGSGIYGVVSFSISGSPRVESNINNNVYLQNCLIIVVSGFTGKIGVSTVSATYPAQVAVGTGYYTITQADAAKIVSDNSDLATSLINGTVYLNYAKDKLAATDFTFTAPTDLVYDGTAKAAAVAANSGINAGTVKVKYRDSRGNVSTTAPKNAGTYTVLIDVTETDEYAASANLTDSSWTFTINKAELIISCEDVTINKGQAIPPLTVKLDGFVNTEDEEYIKGICNFRASVSGVVDTTDTEITSFRVIYSSDVTPDNYYFAPMNVKIKINTVSIADGDYASSRDLTQWQAQAILLTPANGYTQISKDGIRWSPMVDLFSQGINTQTIYLKKDDGTITEGKTISYKIDSTAPTDICVKYGNGEFSPIPNTTVFTKFIKSNSNVDVTATAIDSLSGIAKCIFYASGTPVTDFSGIICQDTLSIEPGSKKIVYVRAMNNAGLYTNYATEGVVVYTDSTVSPAAASFNKEEGKQADVGITMTLNGNTLKEIKDGAYTLVKGTDYTVDGSTVTIKKEYLASQENGNIVFNFAFYPVGEINEENLTFASATVAVTDTTHVHNWSSAWSHDSENHWHACPGCTEKEDVAAHEWDNGVVTTPATAAKEGVLTYTCTICGEKKTAPIEKLSPTIPDSGNIEYVLGSAQGMTISSDSAREDFIGITVDGNPVDASNFTVSADKVTVTLKDDYLQTLGEGKHTISINSKTGSATAEFTIKASSVDHDKAVSWLVKLFNFIADVIFKVSFFVAKTFAELMKKV